MSGPASGTFASAEELEELMGTDGLAWGAMSSWLLGRTPGDGPGPRGGAQSIEMVGGNPPRTAHHLDPFDAPDPTNASRHSITTQSDTSRAVDNEG